MITKFLRKIALFGGVFLVSMSIGVPSAHAGRIICPPVVKKGGEFMRCMVANHSASPRSVTRTIFSQGGAAVATATSVIPSDGSADLVVDNTRPHELYSCEVVVTGSADELRVSMERETVPFQGGSGVVACSQVDDDDD